MKHARLAIGALALVVTGCRIITASRHGSRPAPDDPPLVIADSGRSLLLVAGRAVVESVLMAAADTAPACVSFVGGSAYYRLEAADLSRLAEPHRRYIPRTKCPRTYTSMIALVDSLGHRVDPAPVGYIDPYYLLLELPAHWGGAYDRSDITVNVVQGTQTDTYLCTARFAARGAVAACRHVRTTMS